LAARLVSVDAALRVPQQFSMTKNDAVSVWAALGPTDHSTCQNLIWLVLYATVGSTSSSACLNLIWLEYVKTQVLTGKGCHSPKACKTYISTDNTDDGGNVSREMCVLSR